MITQNYSDNVETLNVKIPSVIGLVIRKAGNTSIIIRLEFI